LTRVVADYVKLRLHVKGVHIHHFVWGILATFIAIAGLYYEIVVPGIGFLYVAMIAAGIGVALVASEAKELVLQKWGR